MQVAKQYTITHYPTAILFLKDIREVVNIFINSTDFVQVQIGNNILKDVDELDELKGESFSNFEIQGRIFTDERKFNWDHLTFKISKKESTTYLSDDKNIRLIGLKQLLEQRLKKNYRKTHILTSYKAVVLMVIISFASIVILIRSYRGLIDYAELLVGLPFLIPALFFFGFPYMIPSRITVAERNERPNFWDRNKDNLIVNLLVGIICAIIGGLFVYYISSGR